MRPVTALVALFVLWAPAPPAQQTSARIPPDRLAAMQARLRQALDLSREITDERERSILLQSIAFTQARIGDVLPAIDTADQITPARRRDTTLGFVARIQFEAGDASGALATANSISDDPARASALSLLVGEYLRVRDLSGAFSTAESIPNSQLDSKIRALREIALWQYERGKDPNGAAATLARATDAAQQINPGVFRVQALAEIARVQARIKDGVAAANTLRDAEQQTNSLPKASDRDESKMIVANSQAQYGDVEEAVRISGDIAQPSSKGFAEGQIAAAFARKGDVPHALESARAIAAPVDRDRAFLFIASAQAGARNASDALSTTALIQDPCQRADSLRNIAMIQGFSKDASARDTLRLALEAALVAKPESPGNCNNTYASLAREFAVQGELSIAFDLANRIEWLGTMKGSTIQSVFVFGARTGKLQELENQAESYTAPDLRAWALVGLVAGEYSFLRAQMAKAARTK